MTISTRREFLGATAATAAVAVFAGTAQPAEKKPDLRLGVIGTGWYGMVDAKAALTAGGAQIVAICDVDSEHLRVAADELEKLQGPRPQTFKLYEDLLAATELDAAVIATPPHWHALQLLACLQKGLDVYCEKPLAYDIREGQAMVEAGGRTDRIVQIGFQRRQSKSFRQVKEFIEAGEAGRIVQVDAQIHYAAGMKDAKPQAPPSALDWDLWCGPRPKLPYSPQVGHGAWRLEKTFGNGHLVDWGIHWIDAIRMILGLEMPRRITASGGIYRLQDKITTPDALTVHFEFDRLPVFWRHRIWGAEEYDPKTKSGIFFYGDKATIFATDTCWMVIPKDRGKTAQHTRLESDLPVDHMADFLTAVRTRKQPSCRIADAYKSTAAVQLAMIAYETGTSVAWDAAREAIAGNTAASALLKRDYRTPWKHPYPS
jgi:predicted dehydrogenase